MLSLKTTSYSTWASAILLDQRQFLAGGRLGAAVFQVEALPEAYGSCGGRYDCEARCSNGEHVNMRDSGERAGRGAAEARDGGVYERFHDEQALLAVPTNALDRQMHSRHEVTKAKKAQRRQFEEKQCCGELRFGHVEYFVKHWDRNMVNFLKIEVHITLQIVEANSVSWYSLRGQSHLSTSQNMGKRSRNIRGGGRGGRGRGSKKSRNDDKADDWRADKFADWVYENESFDAYYKAQNIMADADWDAFKKALATPLPTTFRINSSCPFAERIREHIEQDFKFDGLVVDDEPVEPISSMPWYPDNRGFTWSVERRRVRKLPILKKFQSWLVELSNSGSITRQEAVSMIPPLVLGVEPHHKVLDMCAAPGSKTSQLLESLHSQELLTGKTPTGVVVANDVDLKRAYMLVHQSKRINSPALLVTCHEAQKIPFLGKDGTESEGVFDRILCDAPCSGDGTLRKNPLIWKSWSAKNGIALHPLQLQIAKRGASLLKIGGNMCYSTCTFNPLENEAVVADLLRWGKGSLELVDVVNILPLLKRRVGISAWKVMDSQLKEYASYENYVEENKKNKIKDKIRATMFPPTKKEATDFHLERCMRCLPQDENTGGFFICLLKKIAATPQDEEESTFDKCEETTNELEATAAKTEDIELDGEVSLTNDTSDVKAEAETKKSASDKSCTDETMPRKSRRDDRRNKKGEVYVAFGADDWASVREYYDIASGFLAAQLITRSEDAKSVTFVTESITMDLLEEMKRKKLKVVFAGLKMFERNETAEGGKVYRVCQAGLPHILPFMNRRKVHVSTKDFQMMLDRLGDLLDFEEFEATTQHYFTDAPIGSVVCMLDRPDQSNIESKVMNLVVWRGRNSVNVMAAKADVAVLLGTMKEMKVYDAALQEAILEAKKAKDQERALRDEKKQEEEAAIAKDTSVTPAV